MAIWSANLLVFWLIYILLGWVELTFFAPYWIIAVALGFTITFVILMWLFTLISSYDTANGLTTVTMLLLPAFTSITITLSFLIGSYYLVKQFV